MKFNLFKCLFGFLLLTISLMSLPMEALSPTMQNFLSEYYSSFEKNKKGYSKLQYALEKDYKDIAIKLLKAGEDPNYRSSWLQIPTPFISSIIKEDFELVDLMIKHGAHIHTKLDVFINGGYLKNVSPLYVAAYANKGHEIVHLLCLNKAAVIDSFDEWGDIESWAENPIGIVVIRADSKKFFSMVSYLTEDPTTYAKLIDPDCIESLLTVLNQEFLFKSSKDVNKLSESLEIAQYLINLKVPVETLYASSLTPAILSGNIELIDLLIKSGARVKCWSSFYVPVSTIVEYAKFYKTFIESNPELISYLAKPEEILKLMFDNGASADDFLPEGPSVLNSAISSFANEITSLLISLGADTNLIDGEGKTPLIAAVSAKNLEAVMLLVLTKADPSKRGGKNYNYTPIDLAYSKSYTDILNILIEAEAQKYE